MTCLSMTMTLTACWFGWYHCAYCVCVLVRTLFIVLRASKLSVAHCYFLAFRIFWQFL